MLKTHILVNGKSWLLGYSRYQSSFVCVAKIPEELRMRHYGHFSITKKFH